MYLFRFGEPGREKPGIAIPTSEATMHYDASAFGEDYNEAFFASDGLRRLGQWYRENQRSLPRLREGEFRFGPCVARPSKIICVGLNYKDHAAESNMLLPTEPILFFKSTTALCGPNDNVMIPKGSTKLDWEVELAVIIGKEARQVRVHEAMKYVAGYALHNDYSERAFQLERGGQWVKGKSCDTFAPLGPYLVTAPLLGEADNLSMWLAVNGKTMQNSNTANMVFDVPYLVSYISDFMTLLPGDVISTGTPAGVGLGFNPPIYLKEGDVVELGIHRLGSSRQVVVPYSPH